jgi:hypothetical protein
VPKFSKLGPVRMVGGKKSTVLVMLVLSGLAASGLFSAVCGSDGWYWNSFVIAGSVSVVLSVVFGAPFFVALEKFKVPLNVATCNVSGFCAASVPELFLICVNRDLD